MRHMIWAAALLPGMAFADDWAPLDGPAVRMALTARTLACDGGATQQFNADGSTLYTTDHTSTGAWRVDGAQYCSQWPPSDRWSCYAITRSADGLDLRFAASDASVTQCRYIDLH